jgi:predicted alpha/beta hydrolase
MRAEPLILVVPALGVALGYYQPLVDALRSTLGAEVSMLPLPRYRNWRESLRGGLREEGRCGYADLVQSIQAEAARLKALFPGRPLCLLGHSLGGQVGLLAASQPGSAIDAVVLIACGTPCWRAWPTAQQRRMRLAIGVVNVVSWLLPWYPGRLVGFGGTQPRQLMRDWVGSARSGDYGGIAGAAHFHSHLAGARLSVLAVRIEGDSHAPEGAVEFLLLLLPNATIERACVSSSRLAAMPPVKRHVAWVREPDAVLPALQRWFSALAASARPNP